MKELLERILELIKNETGFVIDEYYYDEFAAVINNRINFYKLTGDNYFDFLKLNHSEVVYVVSCFTVHETSFYRNKMHFDWIINNILPEIINNNLRKKIKILSAGCSTGEEPYTIAMIINEMFKDIESWNIEIFGIDINDDAIIKARNGIYSEYKMRNIDQYYINKYFTISGKGTNTLYTISDKIKKMVNFKQVNLNKKPFELTDMENLDIIFCENVIIYFKNEHIQYLINNLYNMLKEGGYLFLGYSETLNMINHNFDIVWWNDSFAYRKNLLSKKENENRNKISDDYPKSDMTINLIKADEKDITKNREDIIELIRNNNQEANSDTIIEIFKTARVNSIDYPQLYYLLKAEFFFLNKDFMNSSNCSRIALSFDSSSIDSHLILAANYLKLDMKDFAEFEIKTSLYINDQSIIAHYLYAQLHKDNKNREQYNISMSNSARIFNDNNKKLNYRIFPFSLDQREKIISEIEDFIKYNGKEV